MCGIFGYIGVSAPRPGAIAEIADLAGRRGPHACGWFSVDGGAHSIQRRPGALSRYLGEIPNARTVLGHSRLATSGGNSFKNIGDAQPIYIDSAALVHNGVAEKIAVSEPLSTGCDSERLLRRAREIGFGGVLAELYGLSEPFAFLAYMDGVLYAARWRLPLFRLQLEGGDYFCSVKFQEAAPIAENELYSLDLIGDPMTREKMPISNVEWVLPSTLIANDYNPNHVAPIEFSLLRQSLLEDGWTAPIVAGEDNVIVDGFHRWTLAKTDPEVAGMTGGYVPVVRRRAANDADRRIATIRHNRARGRHGIAQMANIVRDLKDAHGLSDQELESRLGMEGEEIERLYDRSGTPARAGKGFGKGWVPDDSKS